MPAHTVQRHHGKLAQVKTSAISTLVYAPVVHLRTSDVPEGRSDLTVAVLSGKGLSSGLHFNSPQPLRLWPSVISLEGGCFPVRSCLCPWTRAAFLRKNRTPPQALRGCGMSASFSGSRQAEGRFDDDFSWGLTGGDCPLLSPPHFFNLACSNPLMCFTAPVPPGKTFKMSPALVFSPSSVRDSAVTFI